MQSHNAYPDPSYSSPAAYNNGAAATLAGSAEPYVHPTIPLGLPHVVQFVEASIHHLPMSVRFVADRLSRYANAKGEVSMAASFLCRITGLGSRNTADHHLRLIESLGVLEKKPGQGGKDRKSNTYVFQGEYRNWKPLPTERPGTDPWVALARSRRENEALRGEIEELQAESGPAHERRNHCSPRSDRWRRGPTPGAVLSQLRNRRSCQIIRGIRSHCSLRTEQWPGYNSPSRGFPQLRNRRSWRLSWGIRSHCSLRTEQWPGNNSPSRGFPQLRNRRSCQIIRGI